ncbi:class I SAM-dependent methyltransferase [Sorangium sp. So ce887]|uniref:class I SAM-dependent methyltransferase n=1 Tax=Sorangium sp. So ce887 TaxID=3133324 RepID=UPI003F5EFCA0
MSAVQSYFDTMYFPINFGRSSALRRTVGRLFRRESQRIAEHGCQLARPHAPRSVLDLGCGTGDLLSALAAQHALERAVGVDISAPALARARERLSGLAGVSLERADVRSCRALASRHDAVLAIGLFDYVRLDASTLRAVLAAASRVVVMTMRSSTSPWPSDTIAGSACSATCAPRAGARRAGQAAPPLEPQSAVAMNRCAPEARRHAPRRARAGCLAGQRPATRGAQPIGPAAVPTS